MVLVNTVLAAVLLSRDSEWMPWLRAVVAVGGVGTAALLLVAGRLPRPVSRSVATLAMAACLAAPAAYSVATAVTAHSGAIPSVGPARHGFGGFTGPGGLLDSPSPGPALSALLSADARNFTWAAATVGSNNAAGYQLASGAPVMAIGGFNGTDPSPTLEEFQRYVADRQIHYFVRGRMMIGHWGLPGSGGSRESADIAEWVETHYTPLTVDRVIVYDLTQPRNS
jgi:4-amino-4-deoxy-L-arabinose transferase-like glycosyltransferase